MIENDLNLMPVEKLNESYQKRKIKTDPNTLNWTKSNERLNAQKRFTVNDIL